MRRVLSFVSLRMPLRSTSENMAHCVQARSIILFFFLKTCACCFSLRLGHSDVCPGFWLKNYGGCTIQIQPLKLCLGLHEAVFGLDIYKNMHAKTKVCFKDTPFPSKTTTTSANETNTANHTMQGPFLSILLRHLRKGSRLVLKAKAIPLLKSLSR